MGRVEFIACLDLIQDLHKRGYSNKYIYDELERQKKITMAYTTFNQNFRKKFSTTKALSPKKENQPNNDKSDLGFKSRAAQNQKGFYVDKSPNPEDLIGNG